MSENQTNEDFHLYLRKVMWYAEQEYEIPAVPVEVFEKSPNANVLIGHCFGYFSSNHPFQNCACSLVEYMKQMTDCSGN